MVTTSASTLILCDRTVKAARHCRHCPIDACPQDVSGGYRLHSPPPRDTSKRCEAGAVNEYLNGRSFQVTLSPTLCVQCRVDYLEGNDSRTIERLGKQGGFLVIAT